MMSYHTISEKPWTIPEEQATYLFDDFNGNESVAVARYHHLRSLAAIDPTMRLSFKDANGVWSKWVPFVGIDPRRIMYAHEIHRSLLYCEVVAESDLKLFEDNVKSMRIVGKIMADRGLRAQYYYSGGKSIHAHMLFDFTSFLECENSLQERVRLLFPSKSLFIKTFMTWLRTRIITAWGTKAAATDENLISASHLIRAEYSAGKYGYKTFITNDYSNLPLFPPLCNILNNDRPRASEIVFCRPTCPDALLEEFLVHCEATDNTKNTVNYSLSRWSHGGQRKMSPGIVFLLSDVLSSVNDGYKRALFLISNELRREGKNVDEIKNIVIDWNNRIGGRLRPTEIEYACTRTELYTVSDAYIDAFIQSLGYRRALDKYEKII